MSFANKGRVWSPSTFKQYIQSIPLLQMVWVKGVVLHHTWLPDLAMRPQGFQAQHIENIVDFYKQNGWNRGPHAFIDEDQIWGMTPFDQKGIHAASFNNTHIGIEVLGNYDRDSVVTGRGLLCWQTALKCVDLLFERLAIPPTASNILFHRDDPKTDKTCPGTLVKKEWVLATLATLRQDRLRGYHEAAPAPSRIAVAAYCREQNRKCELTVREGFMFLNGIHLRTAIYDKAEECTFATITDIDNALSHS